MTWPFTHTLADSVPACVTPWEGDACPDPKVLRLNDALCEALGLTELNLNSEDGAAALTGHRAPEGARPVALAYAGHQFGNFSPQLGDGRALLLGELISPDGHRYDLHLKGSGPTPFSRGGDGKAALGPVLREYLMGEAMHALGVPTTRALAALTTGERVYRNEAEQGAVLARVAASHLRVGTFQLLAARQQDEALQHLADYTIDRHYPACREAPNPYLALLEAVSEAQAALVSRWCLVGFIHGVMNTDNVALSGETIDYGPCAFMDRYDPKTVFSSIDQFGRYAYGNQPHIAQWNMARFAECLLGLIDSNTERAIEIATNSVTGFPERYQRHWLAGMRAKLGLSNAAATDEQDRALAEALLEEMHERQWDFTSTFRQLAAALRGDVSAAEQLAGSWYEQFLERSAAEETPAAARAQEMDRTNPVYIPRNHLTEAALSAAAEGDMKPFDELLAVVTHPFEAQPEFEAYAAPAPASFGRYTTYCGT